MRRKYEGEFKKAFWIFWGGFCRKVMEFGIFVAVSEKNNGEVYALGVKVLRDVW